MIMLKRFEVVGSETRRMLGLMLLCHEAAANDSMLRAWSNG
jgi:hypothetical protein